MKATQKLRVNESPDDDVRQRVSKFLHSRHFPIFRTLGVDVEQGAVTITGVVSSYYQKQIAITSCQHVEGVLSLVDEISVQTDSEGVTEVMNHHRSSLG